jgi:CelD/BcsL family acetyltransferase involved in cellulose biosynthesis
VLPLYTLRRAGLRIARIVGHGVADQLGPVCDPEHFQLALAALACSHGASVLVAERLPAQGEMPGASVLRREASPVISVSSDEGWEQYLQRRSANFRQQVRRRARGAERAGISFRLIGELGELQTALDALIHLHRARWGERTRAFAGARERFHREFAALALERGWLRLWLAEAQGSPVAAWYGFRFQGADYFYQSGRDPAWDRYRVGAALLEHTMREAFADGMREYRLLRGDEPYKQRYASATRTLDTVAVTRLAWMRPALSIARALALSHAGRGLLRRAAE